MRPAECLQPVEGNAEGVRKCAQPAVSQPGRQLSVRSSPVRVAPARQREAGFRQSCRVLHPALNALMIYAAMPPCRHGGGGWWKFEAMEKKKASAQEGGAVDSARMRSKGSCPLRAGAQQPLAQQMPSSSAAVCAPPSPVSQ